MSDVRRIRLSTGTIDLLVTVAVAVPCVLDAGWNAPGTRQADWLTYALCVTSVVPLLVRRRWPVAVTLVCAASLTAWYQLGHRGELLNLPTMVALYTVAVQGTRRRTVLAGVLAALWFGALGAMSDDPAGAEGSAPVLEALWPLIPLALGEAARVRRELVAEREAHTRARVEAERVRIARDLHDVIAHTMAAVNVQMGVAIESFDREPETARAALEQARTSSKEAMRDLRASVALLRESGEASSPRAPAPRLSGLDELAAPVRAGGIEVAVTDDREGASIPAPVEAAAYRVVQEALTNVVRHSGASHAAVRISSDAGVLVVEVEDDGAGDGSARPDGPGGLGLLGMRERVAVLRGSVEHGRTPAGGFRVKASIPIGGLT